MTIMPRKYQKIPLGQATNLCVMIEKWRDASVYYAFCEKDSEGYDEAKEAMDKAYNEMLYMIKFITEPL